MKVKELIEKLQQQDPEKEVMIEQSQSDYDYITAEKVCVIEVTDCDSEDYDLIEAVVIQY